MAAAHVSGVAGLLLSAGVATTPDEVREALQQTAEDRGPIGFDIEHGWGLVDARAALSYQKPVGSVSQTQATPTPVPGGGTTVTIATPTPTPVPQAQVLAAGETPGSETQSGSQAGTSQGGDQDVGVQSGGRGRDEDRPIPYKSGRTLKQAEDNPILLRAKYLSPDRANCTDPCRCDKLSNELSLEEAYEAADLVFHARFIRTVRPESPGREGKRRFEEIFKVRVTNFYKGDAENYFALFLDRACDPEISSGPGSCQVVRECEHRFAKGGQSIIYVAGITIVRLKPAATEIPALQQYLGQ